MYDMVISIFGVVMVMDVDGDGGDDDESISIYNFFPPN
jgi:hypothetical protein